MRSIAPLRNPIRNYAWGSRTALAGFMGRPAPTPEPEAELWMGAHPSAPSQVPVGSRWRSLAEVIQEAPGPVLGERVLERFGPRLPFLFKVLAVERPLSIQAHPDAAQARAGFQRENAAGIPLDAPQRNYRDASHKPELVCALSEFRALVGFRPPGEVADLFGRLAIPVLGPELERLASERSSGRLRELFAALLGLEPGRRGQAVSQALDAARSSAGDDPACQRMIALAEAYPQDVGVVASLLLNPVVLRPGEAAFLGPRELHCYLSGLAVELMANSDNVLRGGLTTKHVDVDELLATLDFDAAGCARVLPEPAGVDEAGRRYRTAAREFELTELRLTSARSLAGEPSVAILLCASGEVRLEDAHGTRLRLGRGQSALVPAAAAPVSGEGRALLYRAAVPNAG